MDSLEKKILKLENNLLSSTIRKSPEKINEILDVDINDPVVSRRLMLSIMLQEQEESM